MQYADYVEARKEWFINPIKQKKQYDKFKQKFLIDVENVAELIGKPITVEVKKAMGKYIYSEVKPFAKPKKEKGAMKLMRPEQFAIFCKSCGSYEIDIYLDLYEDVIVLDCDKCDIEEEL